MFAFRKRVYEGGCAGLRIHLLLYILNNSIYRKKSIIDHKLGTKRGIRLLKLFCIVFLANFFIIFTFYRPFYTCTLFRNKTNLT